MKERKKEYNKRSYFFNKNKFPLILYFLKNKNKKYLQFNEFEDVMKEQMWYEFKHTLIKDNVISLTKRGRSGTNIFVNYKVLRLKLRSHFYKKVKNIVKYIKIGLKEKENLFNSNLQYLTKEQLKNLAIKNKGLILSSEYFREWTNKSDQLHKETIKDVEKFKFDDLNFDYFFNFLIEETPKKMKDVAFTRKFDFNTYFHFTLLVYTDKEFIKHKVEDAFLMLYLRLFSKEIKQQLEVELIRKH